MCTLFLENNSLTSDWVSFAYVNGSFKVFNKSFSNNNRSKFRCPNDNCDRVFKWKRNLTRHLRYECGIMPRFKCPYCEYCCKFEYDVKKHIIRRHKDFGVYVVDIFKNSCSTLGMEVEEQQS
ncbi:Longitudinals lacking protein, isoforms A/B/D/L [Camponotus floridanus]|uniref:Longitudinals lacking protein, isoforms A/B/D/L n=1 Tax=Camponotus floridanus TaxID=104421 RepID=E2AEW2_CAMFO|nr:Longitudinals lacking protein, isoforms A/B/D/L [Camponotus floridanus]